MAANKLSVVIASDNTIDRTLQCVAAVYAQSVPDIEIILADCSVDGSAEAVRRRWPDVKIIHFPQRVTQATLLAAGLRQAQGEFLAVLESHGIPEGDWAAAALTALRTSGVAVGGPVEWAGERRMVDWAAYLCDYGQFMRPRVSGSVSELPGNNCAFPRAWLDKYPEYTQSEFWKTFFLWHMQEREGIRLQSVPSMAIRYERSFPTLTAFLARRFHHARCFGAMRRRNLSLAQRWAFTLLAPLCLPPLFMGRILQRLWPKGRERERIVKALPLIIAASVVWMAGEWTGYVAGTGDSCRQAW